VFSDSNLKEMKLWRYGTVCSDIWAHFHSRERKRLFRSFRQKICLCYSLFWPRVLLSLAWLSG